MCVMLFCIIPMIAAVHMQYLKGVDGGQSHVASFSSLHKQEQNLNHYRLEQKQVMY